MSMSTNGVVIARIAGALYNQVLNTALYNEVVAYASEEGNSVEALANAVYGRDFGAMSDASVAGIILGNLGLGDVAGLDAWLAGQITAAGSNKGAAIVGLLNGFAQLTADPDFGAAATAFNNKINAAVAYSNAGNAQNASFGGLGGGVNFTITAGAALGADIMGLTGDQDVRIDFTNFDNQVKGLDLNGDGVILNNGIENAVTGVAANFEIVDAYARNPLNEYDSVANFLGDIAYDGTGFDGDGRNTDGNVFLGGLGADVAYGGIGNDFLVGGGVGAMAGAGALGNGVDNLFGGRNADFFFVELSQLDNTDKRVNIDGGNTSDNMAAGNAESAMDSDWLLIEASDDAEPVVINLVQGLSGALGTGNIDTRNGWDIGTLQDMENVDASGNLYGFLNNVDVQLGGRNTDSRDPAYVAGAANNSQGSSAQLIVNGSLEANKIIGGYDNDQIFGNAGADLLMGGNLKSYAADGVAIAQQLVNPNLANIANNGMDGIDGGAGNDNIAFEADRGVINGNADVDTLWVTDMALGTATAAGVLTDGTLRFDLLAGNALSAGYGGANVAGTQDQSNYIASNVSGRVTLTNMENVIATGLGAVDFAAAGTNNPELTFQNIQNFQRYNSNMDLRGTAAQNVLYASGGVDTLEGRQGGAWAASSSGTVLDTRDMLSGGNGIDTFVFGTMDGNPAGQAAYGDNIDIIWRQSDTNGDNLWDGYDHVLGTGGNYEQDFGRDASTSQSASALRLTLNVSAADTTSNPLVQNDVLEVRLTVGGAAATLTTAGMAAAATMADLLTEVKAALATLGNADLSATLSGNTISIISASGVVLGGAGYIVQQNSGGSIQNVVSFEPTVVNTTPDVLLFKAYEDRADNEAVNDNSSNGSTISLGVDSYAEDRVVSFQTDAATGRVDTLIAEDQGYRITFDNLTTQDVVTVSVNGVQYTLTVGVDLDGNPIAGEDNSTGITQLAIQHAFINRLAGHINTFMDNNTSAGEVFAAAADVDAPDRVTPTVSDGYLDGADGFSESLVLTQVAYNTEQTVFMRTPTVAVANTSGGESVSWQITNLAQHEVTLYGFDGRNGNLNTTDVKFIGNEGVTRATLQTATTAGGKAIYGNEAVVVDSGANDLAASVTNTQVLAGSTAASVADNTNTNPGLMGLNFAVHGDDLLIGAAGNDTLMGRTGDDRIIGSLGTDSVDGGKNWYAVRVLGETTSRVVEMNAWEAADPAARVSGLAGLTISAVNQVLQSEDGAALLAAVGLNAFDDTLQFQQEDIGANARFLVTLDTYQFATAGTGAAAITTVALNQGGAGHVQVDAAGDGAWDVGQVTTFSNFENIRTVSGTGMATAGNGQGFDTLDVSALSLDAGGIMYNLSGDIVGALSNPGDVRYSTNAAALAAAAVQTSADYTDATSALIIKVDGVENLVGGNGRDYLYIDETEAAKNNTFTAGLSTDVVEYQNDIDGTAAGTGEPVVNVKVNSASDTDTVTMTSGRVGTVVATDTLVSVEHILLNGDTAEGVGERDVLDVTAMTSGAIVDYVTGQVRSAGSAAGTNVQVTITGIEELENVWADGNDTVIVADGSKMNDNQRSAENDATAAENILFMTYRDFDDLNANAVTRKSFAAQVLDGTAMTVVNQGEFSFKLSEVGTDTDTDRVDYSAENGRIVVPVGQGTATAPQYVVVDGDNDDVWANDGETRVDALYSTEEIVASLGDSVMDFTNVNAARQITFQYNTAMADPAENAVVESTIRIADGNGNALTGLTGFVEKYTYNKTTAAVADATWNHIEGGDLSEVVIYNGSEDLVNQSGIDHRFSNDTLTLRGGNNEVRYSPLETSITAVINVTSENTGTTNAAEGTVAAAITFQDGLGALLNANVHNITSHTADNSTAAGTLKIEGSQDAEDTVTFGLNSDKVYVLGSSPGVIEVSVNGQQSVTLTGFEILADGDSNDMYNFSSITNIAGMTFTDNATADHDAIKVGNNAINYNGAGATTYDLDNFNAAVGGLNFDFDVLDISGVTSATLTLGGTAAGADDEVVLGALSKVSNINDFEAVNLTDATIAEGSGFTLNTTANTLTLGSKSITFNNNMNVLSAGGLVFGNELGNSYLGSGATSAVTLTATGAESVTLVGGAGNDTLSGAAAADTLVGGAGNDVLNAGISTEVRVSNVTGVLAGGAGNAAVTLSFGPGAATVTVNEGSAAVSVGAGNDAVGFALATAVNANITAINTAAAWTGGAQLVSAAYNDQTDGLTFTFNAAVNVNVAETITATVVGDGAAGTLAVSTATTTQDGGTGGANVFRGGAGSDTVNGGGAADTMVVVGSVDAAQAAAYLANAALNQAALDAVFVGSGVDGVVNAVVDLQTVHTTSDVASGDTYNGGAGVDTLHIFGKADMTTSVINADVENVNVHSKVTFTKAQLAQLVILNLDPAAEVIVSDAKDQAEAIAALNTVSLITFNAAATLPTVGFGSTAAVKLDAATLTNDNATTVSVTGTQVLDTGIIAALDAAGVATLTVSSNVTLTSAVNAALATAGMTVQAAAGVTITNQVPVATYALTGPATVNEAAVATYTVTTTNVADGTSLAYTLSGTGIDANDFANGLVAGNVTIANGTGTITVPVKADTTTEGSETLVVTLQGQTVSTVIADTSTTPVSGFTNVALRTGTVAGTAAKEAFVFEYTMVGGRATAVDGDVVITAFNAAQDKLVFVDTGTGTVFTEAEFAALSGIEITQSRSAVTTTIALDPNASQQGSVVLAGIVDAALATVVVETLA